MSLRAGGTPGVPTPEALLRRLEWRVLRRIDGQLQGEARSLLRGNGIDVADVREYMPGDESRHIDWNVTARLDVPYLREYHEDRELTAWLLVDTSASMDFGPESRRKHLVGAEIAAVLAQLLTRGGNRVAAMLFDTEVRRIIPPRGGRAQILRIIRELLIDAPAGTDRRGVTDLSVPLKAAMGVLRRRSVVIVISDFISPDGWQHRLGMLAQRHDVMALRISDPREFELPAVGLVYVEDPETGEQIMVDTDDPGFRRRLDEAARERDGRLGEAARSAGVQLLTVSTDEDLVRALVRIVALRRTWRTAAPAGSGR